MSIFGEIGIIALGAVVAGVFGFLTKSWLNTLGDKITDLKSDIKQTDDRAVELLKDVHEHSNKFSEFKGEMRGGLSAMNERVSILELGFNNIQSEVDDLKKKVNKSKN